MISVKIISEQNFGELTRLCFPGGYLADDVGHQLQPFTALPFLTSQFKQHAMSFANSSNVTAQDGTFPDVNGNINNYTAQLGDRGQYLMNSLRSFEINQAAALQGFVNYSRGLSQKPHMIHRITFQIHEVAPTLTNSLSKRFLTGSVVAEPRFAGFMVLLVPENPPSCRM